MPALFFGLICLAMGGSCGPVLAAEVINVRFEVLTDDLGTLTITDVVGHTRDKRFESSPGQVLNFGFTGAAYWLRFRLPEDLDVSGSWVLEVDFPLIDQVDLYIPQKSGEFEILRAGELIPIQQRPLQYRNPLFPVTGEMGHTNWLYLRYQDCGSVSFSLRLMTMAAFTERLKDRQYGLGVYYGTMAIIIFYNLIIFLMVRIRSYFYYVLYAVCFLLWQMTYNGLASEYFWPDQPWLTNQAVSFLISATGFTAIKFSRVFLKTAITVGRLDRLLFWLMACFGLVMTCSLFPIPRITIPLSALLAVIFAPSLLIVSLLCWQKGYRPARYFAIGWFMLLCGTALLGLKSFGLLPSVFITEYGQQLGSVLEIALLSLALADMVNVLKEEKEQAQAEIIRVQEEAAHQLEEKVRLRTRELEVSNRQLSLLSDKLAKYLAPQVYASIFSGRTEVRINSYRKRLTVFFSDIKDFTRLTDSMEPEALIGLINEYLNEMAGIVLSFGGTIDKFMGDAIMVFFGDPESRGEQEDALACVQMAMAMAERLEKLRAGWIAAGATMPLRVRMGINSGYCTVGNLGSENRLDYTIIGGQVNLASRLEKKATPDRILVSHNTYSLIKDQVACQERGEIMVKGIAYPVQTYEVIGLRQPGVREALSFRATGQGYCIRLDPGRMSEEVTREAVDHLHKALGIFSVKEGK